MIVDESAFDAAVESAAPCQRSGGWVYDASAYTTHIIEQMSGRARGCACARGSRRGACQHFELSMCAEALRDLAARGIRIGLISTLLCLGVSSH